MLEYFLPGSHLLSSLNLLSVPKTKTISFGERVFSLIALGLWNDLPDTNNVDFFKSRLQISLFKKVLPSRIETTT